MSFFEDILRSPLPSNAEIFGESGDDDFDKEFNKAVDEAGEDDLSDLFGPDGGDDDDDLSDDDLDGLLDDIGSSDSDDDLDLDGLDVDDECGECGESCTGEDGDEDIGGSIDVGDVPAAPVTDTPVMSVDDPTPAAPLTGEEDQKADDMMAAVGTPVLLEECMTVQEACDFMESGDAEVAISEGLMLESTLTEMVEDLSNGGEEVFTEGVFAPASRPYKMTKKARLNQLYELSLQIEARAHHDPYVKKIDKAYAIERRIKAGWRKRYGRLAMRRAVRYLKRLQRSKSNGLQKAAKQILPKKK
jgi:hypothetical protein